MTIWEFENNNFNKIYLHRLKNEWISQLFLADTIFNQNMEENNKKIHILWHKAVYVTIISCELLSPMQQITRYHNLEDRKLHFHCSENFQS